MLMSRLAVAAILAAGATGIMAGCSSSDFTAGAAGMAGVIEGGSTGGTSGSSGSSGTSGTSGAAGTAGTSGGGQGGASGSAGSAGMSGAGAGGMAGADAGADADAAPPLGQLGATCTDGNACESGNCVDGVCCDSACDGTCKSCDQSGHEGTCRSIASGQDPDKECLGSASAGAVCAGSCDGSGACTFPGGAVPCASSTCSGGTQTDHACGGDGSCGATATSCGKYACGASACKTSCTLDSDCASGAWCNSGSCEDKLTDGGQCNANNQCAHGHCIDSVCCATTCAAPNACDTGQCLCAGEACASGHACVVWHYDQDNDGYASVSASDKPACDNTSPGSRYHLTADDCYDNNANAHPGTTAYYAQDRGDGSYDYNCNGTADLFYDTAFGTLNATCKSCGISCIGNTYGYACSGSCAIVTQEYKKGVPPAIGCGGGGTLYSCSSSGETQSAGSVAQKCR